VSRIFIVGSGVVGSATGRGLERAGHRVTFVDTDPARVRDLLAEGHDATAALDLGALEPADECLVFLTLPTPSSGQRWDLRALQRGVRGVGLSLARVRTRPTVVVRSTVPPGTTETLVRTQLEDSSGLVEGRDFDLAVNPEFLRAATADEDFLHPWMTVIGARRQRVRALLAEVLAPFGGEVRVFDQPRTAELVKCVHNLFNAAKISFWNEIWLVCRQLGIDPDVVAGTVADSAEGSFNRRYGIRGGSPFGGLCLPKDTLGFLGFARGIGISMPLLEAVVIVNEAMAQRGPAVSGTPPGETVDLTRI
jgi:UDPglucose 6-dehydrogenase